MDTNNEPFDADEETLNRIETAITHREILRQDRDQMGQAPGGVQDPPANIPPLPPINGTPAPEADPANGGANSLDTGNNVRPDTSMPVGNSAIGFDDLSFGNVAQPDTSIPLGDAVIGFDQSPEISNIAQPDTTVRQAEQLDPGAGATFPDEPTGQIDEWPDDEMDMDEDSSKFDKVQTWYDGLKERSLADQVAYETAKIKEATRKKRVANRKLREQQKDLDLDDTNDNELFCPANELGPPSEPGSSPNSQTIQSQPGSSTQEPELRKSTQAKGKKQNRISAEDKRRSMRYGHEAARSKAKGKGGKGGRKRKADAAGSTAGQKPEDGGQQNKRKSTSRREKAPQQNVDFDELFATNVVANAQANSSLPAIPVMAGKDKQKALTELVASIPSADQAEAKSDKQLVLNASRKFTNRARADGEGGWKIKGLLTSLYHYQLLGAGFMRDRENSPRPPYGGMLCDVMGLGKTLQALANIVDGRPTEPDDPLKTTLIVVPPHLVAYWKEQIRLHCHETAIGSVVHYHAGAKLVTLSKRQTIQMIQNFDIVITTYDEIRKSYPVFSPPAGQMDDAQIEESWNEVYNNQRGPLHHIKFRRILLDEAHMIKNRDSKTSMAVRGLTGQHKWILSGTPIQNGLTEFYAYFDFLGVPHTGHYADFERNYLKDEKAWQCLTNIVRSILFRRTHASRLFSLPVIKLPDLETRTVETTFCDVEQAIYNRIFTIFTDNINGIAGSEKLARYRCFLTMILNLRMFASHPLTMQDMLKPMLTEDMMQRLIDLSNEKKNPEHPSSKITQWLLTLRKHFTIPTKPSQPIEENQENPVNCVNQSCESSHPPQELQGDAAKLVREFHDYTTRLHNEGLWLERLERTNCPRCAMLPVDAIITSCKHLYCEECYCSLIQNARSENAKPVCKKCDLEIQEAAHCGSIDDLQINAPAEATESSTSQQTPKKRRPQKKKVNRGRYGMFTSRFTTNGETLAEETVEDDDDDATDWIKCAGRDMPGAKLTIVRRMLGNWIAKDREVKVVIFTQFLDFVDILIAMCSKENWGFTCLTGRMSHSLRDKSMKDFKEEKSINVLIASLKAGGTGLDMSMASKCILVDFWWNEAAEEQAICRLYRIGQEQKVEFVKIMVENTIDNYLLDMQNRKSVEIKGTIGDEVLKQRETVNNLLKMFRDIIISQGGRFLPIPDGESRHAGEEAVIELD